MGLYIGSNKATSFSGLPVRKVSGRINITNTEVTDVTDYAQAQVVDDNLTAENIKKNVTILGTTGTFEGSGGSASEVDSGVIFIDYDGAIVESWKSADVASKTALPNIPSHDRLVAQGWNWTLAEIKDYISDYPRAVVMVGQMYKTASGLTEVDITLTKVTGLTVVCNMTGKKTWGDGTTDALTEHTYENYGNYTIACDGTEIPRGTSSSGGMFSSTGDNVNSYWCTAVRIGENVVDIGDCAFVNCNNMTYCTLPNNENVSRISKMLSNCRNLKSMTFPRSASLIVGQAFFYHDFSLETVSIPPTVTYVFVGCFNGCENLKNVTMIVGSSGIPDAYCYECSQLKRIVIPSHIASIYSVTFTGCVNVMEYDFSSVVSVCNLLYIDAFNGINALCKIIVPDALYDDWIVATNWAAYADYIYKASEVSD